MNHAASLGFAVTFLLATASTAKRAAPAEVKPLVQGGVSFRAGHSADENGNRGTVEAVDVNTGKRLWRVTVYEIAYEKNLESDVQDVFIKKLAIQDRCLLVTTERRETFCIDLKTQAVKKLPESAAP